VALVGTDEEEHIASIIRVTIIDEYFFCSVERLLITGNVVPTSPILVTLMMEAKLSQRNVGCYKSLTT
jgi:hypothetical protein